MRLKVGDEPHVNEGLAQGKEELPAVVTVGVGVPEKSPGRAASEDMVFPQVQGLNHGAENMTAVQAKGPDSGAEVRFLLFFDISRPKVAPGGSLGTRAPDVGSVTSGEQPP